MIDAANHAEVRRELRDELHRRMARPQRHRLLQGYPMAPLMVPVGNRLDLLGGIDLDANRPLIIGILPHTFCNPKVKGCGFCTFPHEKLARGLMSRAVDQVAKEIEQTALRDGSLRDRQVEAVYFGGGTANLTPPKELEHLCTLLAKTFDLAASELTLEGVPKYFLVRDEALLDVLANASVRHRRISMGVQTFDAAWLRRMGRDAFGDRDDLQRVVDGAHRRGFTTSADLLFNLPGASLDHALADVRAAVELGFDQVCVYNLVLTPDLDTEWARDRALVQAMPDMATSLTTWLAVRERLLELGYVQTTLTNFERAEVVQTPRRFVYELASFDPATRDGIGFGPGAISTFTSRDHRRAIKWMNVATSKDFVYAMNARSRAVATVFDYSPADLRLLHLTRNVARLSIDGAGYERFFGTDPFSDFPSYFQALEDACLVRCVGQTIELTPKGMFYADAVAGLLAYHRAGELRAERDELGIRQFMG